MNHKNDIIKIAKTMYQKEMVNAFEGNISIKNNDEIIITPSQICKGFLDESMLMTIDLNGHVKNGKYKISSETGLHLEAYRLRKDINAVVHAHSPYATAFAMANQPIESKAYPEMIALFKKVPIIKYGTPSTKEVYADLKNYIFDYDVVLLQNHGIVAFGKDIYDAYFKLESIESIAKVLLLNKLLGGPSNLPDDEVKKLLAW
ncbi:MAG: class II aldolase/adducin family protein [Clostridiales bacterium]|nr:class II aldolase/adducin family protein [Clostridiales bacterium]